MKISTDIHFECPKCKQTLDAPEELANQMIECPTCKEMIEVPRRTRPSWTVEVVSKPALKPPEPARFPEFRLPDSGVAIALTIVAMLDFIGAVIGGLAVGVDNPYHDKYDSHPELGWLIFGCGLLSGLILLGFARVVEYSFQSAERLQRIETLMRRSYDDKPAA